MTTTDPLGYNNTELDKIKYEKHEYIGTNTTTLPVCNIQSHKE